jgi:RNA recognition motif-containing protein
MHANSMRLWISNIPYYWSTIELEKIFSVGTQCLPFVIDCRFYKYITKAFGQVYDVEIPLKNGQSRGYGFVTFDKYVSWVVVSIVNTRVVEQFLDNLTPYELSNRWTDK